ncbi:F-box only protein 21-like isoform X2 [Anticarsia gemmatalis]
MHTFLTLKWVQAHIKNELTPSFVLNFFLQWIDTRRMYWDEDMNRLLDGLADQVESMFPNNMYAADKESWKIRDKLAAGLLSEDQVLGAISDVIYNQHSIKIAPGAGMETLDVVRVFREKRYMNLISAAATYHAVARRCGVHCELIVFPNHLYLEKRGPLGHPKDTLRIDLHNGTLGPVRRCPYSTSTGSKFRFKPDEFLQYIVSAFLMSSGPVKNAASDNATFLLDFLGNNPDEDNPYRNFLPHLLQIDYVSDHPRPLNIKYIHDDYLRIIKKLVNLNRGPPRFSRVPAVKEHEPAVKFAVGMVVYHKLFMYACVIRAWDRSCAAQWHLRSEFKNLQYGLNQPFYSVIALDNSSRYVPQENLMTTQLITRPEHLEENLGREFCDFDGFCYIPVAEKNDEYPTDEPIRQMHRERARVIELE